MASIQKGLVGLEKRLQRTNPEDRAKWQAAVDRAILKSRTTKWKSDRLPDGTVKYITRVGHPVLNAAGDVVQFVGQLDGRHRAQAGG